MRELSFSQLWPKLVQPRYTTFRFPRKDKDWQVGEVVKVLFKARSSHDRSVLGIAEIVSKVPRWVIMPMERSLLPSGWEKQAFWINRFEAQRDGFGDMRAMYDYMVKAYNIRLKQEPMNKLTLAWQQVWLNMPEQKPHIAKQWAVRLNKHNMFQLAGKGGQIAIRQDVLTDIHNEAALGNLAL